MRTLPVAAAALGAALLISACGGSSSGTGSAAPAATSAAATPTPTPTPFDGKTPEQILVAAKDAATAAKSVHVKGAVTQDGETIELDLTLVKGGQADGTMTIQGGLLTLRRVGKAVFMQGDKKFWTASGAGEVAGLLKGKWIKLPIAQKDFGDFNSLTDMTTFVTDGLTPEGTVTRVVGKPFGGVETVGLSDGTGTDAGTLYIAAEGTPYPLAIQPAPSAGPATDGLEFSAWDEAVTVTAPPADDVVDIDKLGG